jgi:hypothetical protein
LESAREQAITATIQQFIPVEEHDATFGLIETVTREYYEPINLGEVHALQVARRAIEDHA